MSEKTLDLIKENEARWVDLRFTDTRGKEQHVTIPSKLVDEDFFEGGKMFDGSSIAGWKGINDSDMVLMPDDSSSVLDPFTDDATVILRERANRKGDHGHGCHHQKGEEIELLAGNSAEIHCVDAFHFPSRAYRPQTLRRAANAAPIRALAPCLKRN